MPLLSLPGAGIHFELLGAGEPLLLVAGLGGAASYWAPNLAAFASRYRLVLHDHRGTGQSTRWEGHYTVELMAEDLLRLMDSLGLERAHLVGHSTGGAIGQVLAARAPDRVASLVLYASWAVLDPQMEACLSLRQRILETAGEEDYHRATPVFLYPPYHRRGQAAAVEAEIAAAVAASPPPSILTSRVAGIMEFDGLPYLPLIRCPVQVLVAEDDILTPPYSSELLAERIAGAELLRLPRGGHALSRTEPEAFAAAVLGFLARHPIGPQA